MTPFPSARRISALVAPSQKGGKQTSLRYGRSDLQLLDRQVGITYSHAQFVSERGEQLDRDVWLLLAQRVKRGRAERKAGQVFIDGDRRRARPAIEQRELADHGTRRKRHQPDVALAMDDMDARTASDDEIEGRPKVAAAEHNVPGWPRHRLQTTAQGFDLILREVAQYRDLAQRQLGRASGGELPQQIFFGPFDRPIDVCEEEVTLEDIG